MMQKIGGTMKILNFGSCNIDYVYSLDHIVCPGETETDERLDVYPGGKGLNQSIAIARAGAEIYHAGCVGEDGEFLTEILKDSGVDITYIKRVKEKNGHAIIQVSKDGENSIFLHSGSNSMITEEHVDMVLEKFSNSDIILLQNEINNLEYIVKKAYVQGMQIILNPSPYNKEISKLDLNMISYLILNEGEAKEISGCNKVEDILGYFKTEYPELKIMLTLGKFGCVYQDKKQKVYHPIFNVETVDTTAAGDTFTGYFIAELASGSNYERILKIASCASAIAVSRKGAAPSIPSRAEVCDFAINGEVKNLDI